MMAAPLVKPQRQNQSCLQMEGYVDFKTKGTEPNMEVGKIDDMSKNTSKEYSI